MRAPTPIGRRGGPLAPSAASQLSGGSACMMKHTWRRKELISHFQIMVRTITHHDLRLPATLKVRRGYFVQGPSRCGSSWGPCTTPTRGLAPRPGGEIETFERSIFIPRSAQRDSRHSSKRTRVTATSLSAPCGACRPKAHGCAQASGWRALGGRRLVRYTMESSMRGPGSPSLAVRAVQPSANGAGRRPRRSSTWSSSASHSKRTSGRVRSCPKLEVSSLCANGCICARPGCRWWLVRGEGSIGSRHMWGCRWGG